MIWARAPCSSSTDVNLDKTEDATEWGPWQGWHFKVWTHWGQSSGRPGTAEEVSLGQSCDTLFGSISREQTAPCGSSTVMRKAASLLGCIRLGCVSIVWKDKAEKPYLWSTLSIICAHFMNLLLTKREVIGSVWDCDSSVLWSDIPVYVNSSGSAQIKFSSVQMEIKTWPESQNPQDFTV